MLIFSCGNILFVKFGNIFKNKKYLFLFS